jgi:acetyl-CoA/propionyl-CoA carboxylase, biotin carboxylase, biotin carboxyl carrier protein
MPDELSPSEVARRLGTSTRTVQRWIERGTLPARRVGGRWRVASDAFDAFHARTSARSARGPIRRLFIANRGEIAARIARTCDRLGIVAIVPETEGPAALDLLDADAVVAAARAATADALHPGFGFLAESADFAEWVIAGGLAWVGPPPDAIRTMGDKAAARRLAASVGVPVLSGYDDPGQSDEALRHAADRIGYPILVKPAAGGGGKGMRTVRDPATLDDSIAGARREATAAFGDDRLILERYVERGRHIEIQVLFDAAGDGVHLGERDCSIQRRHQKILEESPSPAVAPALRARLGDAALELGRAVGYVNAGTCEFLVDDRGEPAFLEMNTRLQVEHPVTELVTGRDLVEDQLRIAAGEGLGFGQRDVTAKGHAIEVRLYAEDAEAGFVPAVGRVEALRWPGGEGIRVDAGIDVGTEVGARFDPMLAKVVAWGPSRDVALDRLTAALDDTVVLGLVTNLRFLRWLVRQPVVREGAARTDTLDRIWPPDDWAARSAIPDEAWTAAAAAVAHDPRDPAAADPWADGWRLNGPPTIRLEADGVERRTPISDAPGGLELVRVGDRVHVDVAGRSVAIGLAPAPDVDRAAHASATASGVSADVVAPMPGQVLTVHAGAGAALAAGDPVVTLEAMKMEHVVVAPIDGRLADLAVAPGDQVVRGQRLATVEPAP